MKIKSINIIKYRQFNNHKVIFGDSKIPTVSFLVGNNGSGKTQIFELIHGLMDNASKFQEDFEVDFNLIINENEKKEALPIVKESDFVLKIKRENGNPVFKNFDSSGNEIKFNRFHGISKIVYSQAEVSFPEVIITNTTEEGLDKSNFPKVKSKDLYIKIPQLIINLESLDEKEKIEYIKINPNILYKNLPSEIGSRLQRFVDVFYKFFGKSVVFLGVKIGNNNKRTIMFKNSLGEDIFLNHLSTGEKQIIYRIAFILQNIDKLNGAIILIDEPELSLHPDWQKKFKDIICEIFKDLDVQIIMATHSPFMFGELDHQKDQCIKIEPSKSESKKIDLFSVNNIIKGMPTINLITYLAYGIATEVLHIELYTMLQIYKKKDDLAKFEDWLSSPEGGNLNKVKTFKRTKDYHSKKSGTLEMETLPTYIRHGIHHLDEEGRNFTTEELEESIDMMIELLK